VFRPFLDEGSEDPEINEITVVIDDAEAD